MNYVELLRSSIVSLKGNVLRTALTMLGIIIGIASVILIVSIAQGATSSITSQVSSLGTNLIFISPGAAQNGPVAGLNTVNTLTNDDAQAIIDPVKVPHATASSGSVQTRAQVVGNGENTNTTITGVSEGFQIVQSLTMDLGQFISSDDEASYAKVAVLGSEVSKTLFGEDADPVGQNISINSRAFRIIGVTHPKGGGSFNNPDDVVYVPVTTAMKILLGRTNVQFIQVTTDSPSTVNSTISDINQLLLDRHKISDPSQADFTIRSSQEALTTLNNITGMLTAMLAGIASIALLVGGIGIMNIMLVTVTERTKEVGLLKAIGAKRKNILTQFLIESILLTVTGGVVGILLGASLAYLLSTFILHIPFVIQYLSIILAFGVSTLVGLIFGIYPANKAAKLNAIDALRYE